MADQHYGESDGKDNAAIESSESKGVVDRHSDEHVSNDNVSVGNLESTSVTGKHSEEGVSIADVALESLSSKDAENEHSDKGLSTDHAVATSSESTYVADKHSNEGVSIADVALESLSSKDAENEHSDKGLSTDHVVATSSVSTGVAEKHSDEGVTSIADVALESLKSKDSENEHSDKGLNSDHVVAIGLESTGAVDKHSDEGVSIADVALESLKSKETENQHPDKGLSTDVATSLESTGKVDKNYDEGVTIADVALESLKSKEVENQHSDTGLSTANAIASSLKSTGVADKHSDEGVSIADPTLESLKSKSVADKHVEEGAITANANDIIVESTRHGTSVEINVMTLDSQLHSFNVDKNMQVSIFKDKIASEVALPVEQQRLIFRGKVLKDDDLLSEYHIENGHTLHVVARQPSEFQPSSGTPNVETTARSSYAGQDVDITNTYPQVGHVSHSVVLGTFGAGDQDDGGNPDISQVIGAVLNSFGLTGQAPLGGTSSAQTNMQFSIPVQVAQGNETGASVSNHAHTENHSQPRSSSQSVPRELQVPAPTIPTLATPIPESLYTLSMFMNHMERALSQNGITSRSNSTESLPAVELPLNVRGLLSPAALVVVLRHAQRLLSGSAIDSLSHIARRMEEDESSSDVTVRTQIQTEVMQSGLAMQHLGALLLELGRTMLTLRVGQTPAESSVNAGPAVYISSSGPNPIMVQPFPLQTNSLFGSHVNPTVDTGGFGPIGGGAVPRHLNIHIHAGVGPRGPNVESNQRELTIGNAGASSQTRSVGDNMRSENQASVGHAEAGLPEIRTDGDTGYATSDSIKMKSLSETEGGPSSSRRSNTPRNASGIPLGLGPGGLQPKRRHRQTRSEMGSSGASSSHSNQGLASPGGQWDPATTMNQVMQNPALVNMLAGVSNQPGAPSPDFLKNLLGQLAQNPAMMNTVTQQMDGNQDLASMLTGTGGPGGGGNQDMSNMIQQMMPFVCQALNSGSSSSNSLQSTPSRKGTLQRRYSSVKSLNVRERSSSDFQMNLENAAQKIVEQYPPLEIFSSVVETAAALHNNVFDHDALEGLCMEEEQLALEFNEMLKRDISRRLQGARR
uniref:ubiquitin-like domain-containing protein CIP73 n=1 Tax=Erigeron canadensis TaxID=72917 RepID=UPI001CB99879|nr:ubiquitin-like domain-containing protein CIP73 [Erigeron canadensis]